MTNVDVAVSPGWTVPMLDARFVELLACPETKRTLRLASQALTDELNAAIARGEVVNRGSRRVDRPVEGLLVRDDNEIGYPIWDGIPTLLIDEGIPLRGLLESVSEVTQGKSPRNSAE